MQKVLDLLSFLLRKIASAEILFGLMGKVGEELGKVAPRGAEHLIRLRNLLLEQEHGIPKALETI